MPLSPAAVAHYEAEERRVSRRRRIRDGVIAVALLVLVFSMVGNWGNAYFSILETADRVTTVGVVTWIVLAVLSAGLVVVSFFEAALHGRRGAAVGYLLMGVLVAFTIFAFSVPRNALTPPPAPNQLPSNYVPCYSGSGDCVGG